MKQVANDVTRRPKSSTLQHHILQAVRVLLPVAILAWLLIDLQRKDPEALRRLVIRAKDFRLLAASLLLLFVAVCASFVRWFLMVRALEIPFRLRDAFRLGFLGFLFNFIGPGAVGGDLFKAYSIAKDQKSRRAEAVATILIDRLVGMYSLLIVATAAILFRGTSRLPDLGWFLSAVPWLTLLGGIVILGLLLPGRRSNRIVQPMIRFPYLGPIIRRTTTAVDLYRRRRSWLIAIGLLGISGHLLVALSMHFADRAIHPVTPTFSEHLIISPLATAASALPVPGGLGTYEAALNFLFQNLPTQTLENGQGLAVAICYRLMTVLIAGVCMVYYMLNRRSVTEVVTDLEAAVQSRGHIPLSSDSQA